MTETTASVPTYVYVTHIRASSQDVWQALTDAETTARYWGRANLSDWRPDSRWEHRRVDGSGAVDVSGEVLEAEPPARLVITFEDSGRQRPNGPSVVMFRSEPHDGIVRLTVTHENLPNADMMGGISHGWPSVLANLTCDPDPGALVLEQLTRLTHAIAVAADASRVEQAAVAGTIELAPHSWDIGVPLPPTGFRNRWRARCSHSCHRSLPSTSEGRGSPHPSTSHKAPARAIAWSHSSAEAPDADCPTDRIGT